MHFNLCVALYLKGGDDEMGERGRKRERDALPLTPSQPH